MLISDNTKYYNMQDESGFLKRNNYWVMEKKKKIEMNRTSAIIVQES